MNLALLPCYAWIVDRKIRLFRTIPNRPRSTAAIREHRVFWSAWPPRGACWRSAPRMNAFESAHQAPHQVDGGDLCRIARTRTSGEPSLERKREINEFNLFTLMIIISGGEMLNSSLFPPIQWRRTGCAQAHGCHG